MNNGELLGKIAEFLNPIAKDISQIKTKLLQVKTAVDALKAGQDDLRDGQQHIREALAQKAEKADIHRVGINPDTSLENPKIVQNYPIAKIPRHEKTTRWNNAYVPTRLSGSSRYDPMGVHMSHPSGFSGMARHS